MNKSELLRANWNSVYQQESFHRALESSGVIASKVIEIGGKKIYFMRATDGSWVAWELDKFDHTDSLPPNHRVLRIDQVADYDEIDWTGFAPNSDFATLITTSDTIPSKRFVRGVKKAKNAPLSFHQADTDSQIRAALNFVSECGDCIDPIKDREAFEALAIALLHESIGQTHIIRDETTGEIQAASLSVISPNQANLRWYRSMRANNSGHLLASHLIDHHLQTLNPGSVVNLSGVVPPNTEDKKLLSINEFKRQISNTTVVFGRT